jgi:hypothetical protein
VGDFSFAYVSLKGAPRLLMQQTDAHAIQLAKVALYAGAKLLMSARAPSANASPSRAPTAQQNARRPRADPGFHSEPMRLASTSPALRDGAQSSNPSWDHLDFNLA